MNANNFTRRDCLKSLGLAAVGAGAWWRLAAAGQPSDRPNIVLILADDMGCGDLACQNPDSKIVTPNLDRLAEQGVRFTDAHSPSSVGRGSRYGLLTGRYPWRAELKRRAQQCWSPSVIEPDRLTVGKLLEQHGYDTACIGKWHLGMDWPTTDGKAPICVGRTRTADGRTNVDFSKPIASGPTAHGFNYYFGVLATHFPPYCFIENEHTVGIPSVRKSGIPGCPGPMLEGWKLEEILPELMKKAVEYIDAKGGTARNKELRRTEGEPFFLYVPLTAPRVPIVPAEQFTGKSKAGPYGDFVQQVDYVVGQVGAALKRNGFERDTLLIFTSDNGSPARDGTRMFGAVGSVEKLGHNPSHIYRGLKADAWEGGHRVPFVARWPGRIAAGSTSEEPICHVDLLATCAAILGAKLPVNAGEDSHDILPALLAKPLSRPIREAVVHHSGNHIFAVRSGKWKLILGLGSGGFSRPALIKPEESGPTGQLYDMEADASEKKNLYLERPDVVKRLEELLERYKSTGRSAPRT